MIAMINHLFGHSTVDADILACHYCYLVLIIHSGYLKNGLIVANNYDFCTTPLVLHSV